MLKETTRPGCGDTGEAAVQFMEAGIQGVGAVRGESPFPGLIGGKTDSPGGASVPKSWNGPALAGGGNERGLKFRLLNRIGVGGGAGQDGFEPAPLGHNGNSRRSQRAAGLEEKQDQREKKQGTSSEHR